MLVGNRRNKGNSMRRREGVEKGERGRVCRKERRKEEAPAVGAPHQFLIRKTPKKQTPWPSPARRPVRDWWPGLGGLFALHYFF